MSYLPYPILASSPRRTPGCGRFLAEVRRRHGLTQRALAERAGTTQTSISRIERDQVSPSVATLNRLLEALGETLALQSVPLASPPPGGGNVPIGQLRADFENYTPAERLQQAIVLSRTATKLAAAHSRAVKAAKDEGGRGR